MPNTSRIRIALAQMNAVVGDVDGNARRILDLAARAKSEGANLVIFPELAITGYPPEDLILRPSFVDRNITAWEKVAREVTGIAAVVGFVDRDRDGCLYNAAGIAMGGKPHGVCRKMHLPNYGVFDEMRYFKAGDSPFVFHVGGVGVGVTVCEDVWVANGPVPRLSELGAKVIVNISSSPYHAGKVSERFDLLAGHAKRTGLPVAYVNLVGGQDELVFDGGSMVVGADGSLLARAAMFREELLLCDLGGMGTIQPLPDAAEEVLDALILGTRDYIDKNRFPGAVIGLSGGIDSSLVAAVAVEALGADRVVGVTMSSEFTSRESVEDAHELARNMGIRCVDLSIKGIVAEFGRELAPVFAGRNADLTEENIQARARGTLLMAFSNKFGHLVLTTGNKSEMSVGYATLYGDMAGGYAVIKDVFKTTVYAVCRRYNAMKGSAVIPERVLTKPPSAELRPDQKDSDSLPEYDVLDPILRMYVEADRSVPQIVAAGFDEATVRRVARLVDRSEFKRRQSPPGVKITPRALGRDRRMPLTDRSGD